MQLTDATDIGKLIIKTIAIQTLIFFYDPREKNIK